MYVFVTVAELTGAEKKVALGQVEDDVTLDKLLQMCLDRIDKHLPEHDRDVSRHFWFNERFVPFERGYLRDLASTINITLELRPDHYQVELPRESAARYAIDPELQVSQAIDRLMRHTGAWRCYELLPRDGRPLQQDISLVRQEVLPYHARLSQTETVLVIRRKARVLGWSFGLLALFIGAGLLFGYMFALLRHAG